VIVGAVRTPVGRRNGGLAGVHAVDLGAAALRALVERSGVDPMLVDDVIMGCVSQIGEQSVNVARNAWLAAGLPEEVPATTIDRQCGSSQQAVQFAAQGIMAGGYQLVVAAGVEHMTRVPMGSSAAGGPGAPIGPTVSERYGGRLVPQGISAELINEKWGLTREEQDAFALRSHQRAAKAVDSGLFDPEIVPLPVRLDWLDDDGRPQHLETTFARDEGPRRDTSAEALAKLKPVFKQGGTITAGNSSQRSDGAAAVVVMERERAERLALRPLARFVGYAVGGVDPEVMGIGPTVAVPKVLELTGLRLPDIDLVELNEAFASQTLAVVRELGMDMEKVNVNGGAIALGHPMGATGSKLTIQLLAELARRQARYGMVTMCVGGGQGAAGIFENLQN
jgi:acetyl-CoA acetyltransferase family protein